MKNRQKTKEETIQNHLETEREFYLHRACTFTNSFYSAFFVQCVESAFADGWEMFFEDYSSANYFRIHKANMDKSATQRFYKLAGIHHTLWILCHKKKMLDWAEMKEPLYQIYDLTKEEKEMTEILYRCSYMCRSRFQDLFARVTAKYLFSSTYLTPFLLAFLVNFWYNSYNSFMMSFTGYVPFQIRWEKSFVG